MHRTDSSIKAIVIPSIKRHTIEPLSSVHTRYYESNELTGLAEVRSEIQLVQEELPIASTFFSRSDWTVVTTRRIIGVCQGVSREVSLGALRRWQWGNFKGYGNERSTIMTLTSKDGHQHSFILETGDASMVLIYGIQTGMKLNGTQDAINDEAA
jgi:hypothetical protein